MASILSPSENIPIRAKKIDQRQDELLSLIKSRLWTSLMLKDQSLRDKADKPQANGKWGNQSEEDGRHHPKGETAIIQKKKEPM